MSVLMIPVDASNIPEQDRKQQKVKVAVQQKDGVKSQIISLDGGRGEVKLDVDPKQTVSIAIGPATASDEDMFHLQTLTASVSPTQWGDKQTLTIPALTVTPQWWSGWLRWCREFVVQGRVLCADGSPVPGAEVRAFDVDFFWWWSSIVQVGGSVVTDAAGHFTMRFRWCCGWFPWWWWAQRQWRLDFDLVNRVLPITKLNPQLRFPEPDPVPSLDFSALGTAGVPQTASPAGLSVSKTIDPTVLPALREKLISVLPHVPELERLRIWPWFPWSPWFDCAPDLIFRVTQQCGAGPAKVIVNENVFQTRWDIPTNLNVTLIANQLACCLGHEPPPPPGDCLVMTSVCGDPGVPVTSIGGNLGAAVAPIGYADPGGRDRPFSEVVSMNGLFGSSAQADFYEIEFSPHSLNTWAPVPFGALRNVDRQYFDSSIVFPASPFIPVTFSPTALGAGGYYESRHHYEVGHPSNWGNALTGRVWSTNGTMLAAIETAGFFSDGAYDFRVIGYLAAGAVPNPATRKVMPNCGQQNTNNLVLRIDNRVVLPQVQGTVHVSTTEPDCGITNVLIGGSAVAACDAQQLKPGQSLEVFFSATDSDPVGHLDHYTLEVKYGLGSVTNLLNPLEVGASTLSVVTGGPKGPDYSDALAQGSPRPIWKGGSMHLTINDASRVFPKTCCYLLELTVWKRNIANCGTPVYYNQFHYSFTVTV